MKDICAVIVTYNPNPLEVQTLIERIAEHVGLVVIVDNGSRNVGALLKFPARLIELGSNKGVATAQNVGIRAALELDYKFVILFDHDSLPMPDMVPKLRAAYAALTEQGIRVAAIGPNWQDRNTGRMQVAVKKGGVVKQDILISSGCLMPVESLRDVGLMQDDLFIEYSDVEWCMRAVTKHREHNRRIETVSCWKNYIATDALMGHTWSNGVREFGFLSAKTILPYYPLIRYYYAYRNATHLCLRSKYRLSWKVRFALYRVGMFVAALLGAFPGGRWRYLRMMLSGIWDGLFGRLGPHDSAPVPHHPAHANSDHPEQIPQASPLPRRERWEIRARPSAPVGARLVDERHEDRV